MTADNEVGRVPQINEKVLTAFTAYVGLKCKLNGVDLNSPQGSKLFIEAALASHAELQQPQGDGLHPAFVQLRSLIVGAPAEEINALGTVGVLQAAAHFNLIIEGLHAHPDALMALSTFALMRRRGLPISLPNILQARTRI